MAKKSIAQKPAQKKMTAQENYKKGVVGDQAEIMHIVKRSTVIYVKQQTIYDDGSQSATVEIHFMPKK